MRTLGIYCQRSRYSQCCQCSHRVANMGTSLIMQSGTNAWAEAATAVRDARQRAKRSLARWRSLLRSSSLVTCLPVGLRCDVEEAAAGRHKGPHHARQASDGLESEHP